MSPTIVRTILFCCKPCLISTHDLSFQGLRMTNRDHKNKGNYHFDILHLNIEVNTIIIEKYKYLKMLTHNLMPAKFLFAMIQVVAASLMLSTQVVYPTQNSTTTESFYAGCAMIIVFCVIQIIFNFIGINIFNNRIHFENLIFNGFAAFLLVWFIMAKWPKEYVWLIWGFLCLYPFLNELVGMVSVLCHQDKAVYEKYKSG